MPNQSIPLTGQKLLQWLQKQPAEVLNRPVGKLGNYGEFEPVTTLPTVATVLADVQGDRSLEVIRLHFAHLQ